jgi:hypothetical protein
MHAKDLVGINGSTQVLLVYTCQQGEYPRGYVLPLRIPYQLSTVYKLKPIVYEDCLYLTGSTESVPSYLKMETQPVSGK